MSVPNVAKIRRICLLCNTYRMARPGDNERKLQVISELNELVYLYNQQYNELRRADASVSAINKAKENKTLFLDSMSECRECNKEIDKVNRKLMSFKQTAEKFI